VWLIFGGVATNDKPRFLGIPWDPRRRRCRAVTSSTLPNMETPAAFDHSIRFSVPTHQRSTFDRAVAGLPPAFLGFPTTGEVFESTAACKARLQGFSLGRLFRRHREDVDIDSYFPHSYA
jgi:hypothetical protein